MSTQWNDLTLDDILSDVQRMTRERGEAESAQPIERPAEASHNWTLDEVDRLLGLDDSLSGISDYSLPETDEEPELFPRRETPERPEPAPEEPDLFDLPEAPARPEPAPEEPNLFNLPETPAQPEPAEKEAEPFDWLETPEQSEPAEKAPKTVRRPKRLAQRDFTKEMPELIRHLKARLQPENPEKDKQTARRPKPDANRVPVAEPVPLDELEIAPEEEKTKIIGRAAPQQTPRANAAAKPDPEMVDGQMMLQGFTDEEPVQQVDERQAEQELNARREAQVKDFKLVDYAKKYEPDLPPRTDIFEPEPEPAAKAESSIPADEEYVRLSDRMRIGRLLQEDRRRSFFSLCALIVLCIASVAISAIEGAGSSDSQQILCAVNLVLLSLSVAASIDTFFAGARDLFRWKPSCSSAAFLTVVITLIHGIVVFFVPEAKELRSTFCAPAVFSLLLGRCARMFETVGILDNFKFCAFSAAEHLHTVRGFEHDADAAAIGKALEEQAPNLRYSQRVKFPAKFRELSDFRSVLDNLCRLLLPAALGAALIMALTGWLKSGSLLGALPAFTQALCVALPSAAALTVSIPAVILMHNLNRNGGMIVSPAAAAANAGVHAVAMDAVDLYDSRRTEIYCYQDYGAIRIDDVFLYAAALAVGAHSPSESAFLHTVGNPDILPPVRSLIYEERLGISANIRNQSVLLGSRNLLSNHSIDPPSKSGEVPYLQEGKRVLYLAVDSKVCAMFVIDYVPKAGLAKPLKTLQDNGTRLLVWAPDCNTTEDFIASGFSLKKGDVRLTSPAAGELLRTRLAEESDSAAASVMHDGSSKSLLHALADAAVIRNIQRIAAFIAVIGCGIGWLVSFILLLAKGIDAMNWLFAVLYPALWMALSLALGILQAHKATHSK